MNNSTALNKISINFGLIGGFIITLYLFIFQLSGNDYAPYLKLIKYLLLAIPIIWALNRFKSKVEGEVFKRGMLIGVQVSAIAAFIVAISNLIIYFISSDLAFNKFSLLPSSIDEVILVTAMLFVEIFVFGNIISFIALQFLKEDIKDI